MKNSSVVLKTNMNIIQGSKFKKAFWKQVTSFVFPPLSGRTFQYDLYSLGNKQ